MTGQPDFFAYRDLPGGLQAPSGPATTIPTKEEGARDRYLAWRLTDEGLEAWALIVYWALQVYEYGSRRISVNRLVERVRDEQQIKVNNSWRAQISDDLIRAYPQLEPLIERRKRTKLR